THRTIRSEWRRTSEREMNALLRNAPKQCRYTSALLRRRRSDAQGIAAVDFAREGRARTIRVYSLRRGLVLTAHEVEIDPAVALIPIALAEVFRFALPELLERALESAQVLAGLALVRLLELFGRLLDLRLALQLPGQTGDAMHA